MLALLTDVIEDISLYFYQHFSLLLGFISRNGTETLPELAYKFGIILLQDRWDESN